MTRRWGRDPFRTGLVQAVEDAAGEALAASTTPGLAVALVHQGQVAWAAGYGVGDRTTWRPVSTATRFQAASLSKPVTAWGCSGWSNRVGSAWEKRSRAKIKRCSRQLQSGSSQRL
jgi:CubicO group peptidase (beta-lactamase class C family)